MTTAQGAEKNLIIDTDVGVDDALAIALALTEPSVHVHAITTVFGNVETQQVVRNAATITKLFGKPLVPIYIGAQQPLVAAIEPIRWQGHGKNGMGGSSFDDDVKELYPDDPNLPNAVSESAALALVRMVTERPNFYDILALGPLTNIALACKIDPDFPNKVRHLVWMGGSASGKGNVTVCAEFNAHSDPDAAHVVLESWADGKMTMVPWELCVYGALSWAQYHHLTDADSRLARFLKKIALAYETYSCGSIRPNRYYQPPEDAKGSDTDTEHKEHQVLSSHSKFCPADVYALFAYLHPECVTRCKTAHCMIETSGRLTKGYIAVDWFGAKKNAPKVRILRNVDRDAFAEYMAKRIGADVQVMKQLALPLPSQPSDHAQ